MFPLLFVHMSWECYNTLFSIASSSYNNKGCFENEVTNVEQYEMKNELANTAKKLADLRGSL